jgi:Zn-dependent peptidase ImmA (M78 family)
MRPVIVTSAVVKEFDNAWTTYRGFYYEDEPYIFVRDDMEEDQYRETMIHEMVHYVIYKLGFDYDTCEHERLARLISGGDWGDSVRSLYGC